MKKYITIIISLIGIASIIGCTNLSQIGTNQKNPAIVQAEVAALVANTYVTLPADKQATFEKDLKLVAAAVPLIESGTVPVSMITPLLAKVPAADASYVNAVIADVVAIYTINGGTATVGSPVSSNPQLVAFLEAVANGITAGLPK